MPSKKENPEDQSATQPVEDGGIGHVPDEVIEVVDDRDTRPRDYVETSEPVELAPDPDTSDANDIGHVPDPPFYGRYQLGADVDFANAEGGETHVAAGVINGHELPVDVAETLAARGLLTKV